MNFPSWVKKIRFAVRPNDDMFLLSWDTNKVEFLDASGNITSPTIAANIKVYLDGLNTFILNSFTNTNVSYQFVAGDRIRFITNGDGTPYLTSTNNGLIDLPVSKLVDGDALLIPFDARLATLTANATFELYRVPVCTSEPVYLEQCDAIPVLFNGTTYEPTITSGIIPFFDVYWFFRSIPQTDQHDSPIIFVSQHRYEHFAASDFWGTAISNSNVVRLFATGRAFVRNENARQTWLTDEIVVSEVLLEDGVWNGLSTFKGVLVKNYFVPDSGGIVAMKAQTGLLFALCENNWFVVNIAQNLLMITAGGNVQANPDYLGNKQQKIGNVYGCDFRDTSTIIFKQEWISWGDIQREAWCKSNYQTVWDITKQIEGVSEGNVTSYFIEKLRYIASLRNQNQWSDAFMYLHAGYYPKKNEIVITSFARSNASPSEIEYTSQQRDYDIQNGETISFNLGGFWSGMYSWIPEAMIDFGSGDNGNQLILFKQGQPYIQDKITTSGISYLNFFGVQTEAIVEFVINGGEGKNEIQKRFLAIRVLCKQSLWFSDKIWTQAQQFSNLPIEEFAQIENYSESGILCDGLTVQPNGISAIYDGDSLSGQWIKIRLRIDPNNVDKYFSIEGIIVSSTESF
jgi:hypothetical protein